ncbi:MAG: hypothetical protein WC249_01230 [Patescibacteria group bacterium]|jgi:hypothetical protein
MKKYQQAAASIALLTIMLSFGLYSDYSSDQEHRPRKRPLAKQEVILKIFENHDYEAWRLIMARNNKDYTILARSDFDAFIQARQAARSGNYDQAIEISRQLETKIKDKIDYLKLS